MWEYYQSLKSALAVMVAVANALIAVDDIGGCRVDTSPSNCHLARTIARTTGARLVTYRSGIETSIVLTGYSTM
jgi:hypothetical protein